MHLAIYLFFAVVLCFLFFVSSFTFSFTSSRYAMIPIVFSLFLSIILCLITFTLNEEILSGWESITIAGIWFSIFLISFVMMYVVAFNKFSEGI